jgi:hypothetical protein
MEGITSSVNIKRRRAQQGDDENFLPEENTNLIPSTRRALVLSKPKKMTIDKNCIIFKLYKTPTLQNLFEQDTFRMFGILPNFMKLNSYSLDKNHQVLDILFDTDTPMMIQWDVVKGQIDESKHDEIKLLKTFADFLTSLLTNTPIQTLMSLSGLIIENSQKFQRDTFLKYPCRTLTYKLQADGANLIHTRVNDSFLRVTGCYNATSMGPKQLMSILFSFNSRVSMKCEEVTATTKPEFHTGPEFLLSSSLFLFDENGIGHRFKGNSYFFVYFADQTIMLDVIIYYVKDEMMLAIKDEQKKVNIDDIKPPEEQIKGALFKKYYEHECNEIRTKVRVN